MMGVNLGDNT